MARDERIFEQILEARGAVAFRDMERVLRKLGFELARTRGSHHTHRHPRVPRHLGGEAKPYQIRQLRDMIEEFNLKLED